MNGLFFHHIGNFIITDFHHHWIIFPSFFRGVGRSTTNQPSLDDFHKFSHGFPAKKIAEPWISQVLANGSAGVFMMGK
jgi:hypothetical protein